MIDITEVNVLIRYFFLCGLLGIWAIIILFFVVFSPTVVAYQTYAGCQIALSKQGLKRMACKNHQDFFRQYQQLYDSNSTTSVGLMHFDRHRLLKHNSTTDEYEGLRVLSQVPQDFPIRTAPVRAMLSVHVGDYPLCTYEEDQLFHSNNDFPVQQGASLSFIIKNRLGRVSVYSSLMNQLKGDNGESLAETTVECDDGSYVVIFCPYRSDKPELSRKQHFSAS